VFLEPSVEDVRVAGRREEAWVEEKVQHATDMHGVQQHTYKGDESLLGKGLLGSAPPTIIHETFPYWFVRNSSAHGGWREASR
jgi:hypothetical protein